jgi:hypothetical protein
VKQIEIHGRSLKKPTNRELIVERARGFRRTLTGLRAEYEAAKAQHEQEVRRGGRRRARWPSFEPLAVFCKKKKNFTRLRRGGPSLVAGLPRPQTRTL